MRINWPNILIVLITVLVWAATVYILSFPLLVSVVGGLVVGFLAGFVWPWREPR